MSYRGNGRRIFLPGFCLGIWVAGHVALAGDAATSTIPAAPAAEAAAHVAGFQLAPGLQLQIWATEPQLQNGVALSFDGRGRCFVAETHRYKDSIFDITQHTNWLLNDLAFRSPADRGEFLADQFAGAAPDLLTRASESVRVLEDRTGAGHADFSQTFADGFNTSVDGTAAGVLARDGDVWFACLPSLWRMADDPLAGPGRPRTRVAHGFGVHIGVTGHDLHGLIKGPDGRIYMSFGDRGLDVSTLTNFAPVPPHVAGTLRDTGGVLRCEPDGTGLELYCYGLRNPQELAFDDLGNLWTVDNDTAGADPCRVLHLVEGGDYGWRCSYQHMEGFGPWVQEELWKGGQDGILPSAGTVSQGPSGLAWYPGTGFGDRFAGKFLHCDFPAGVCAFSLRPSGASYVVDQKERFLWNCWATDVDFGPDGAAYVLDWVSGWQMPDKGRIYRITDPARMGDPLVAEVRQLLAAGMKARPTPELLVLLAHADRRVRLEAQWALAERGVAVLGSLTELSRSSSNPRARLHALWATGIIVRHLPKTEASAELASLLKLLADPDPEIRGQTALTLLGDGRLVNAERPAAALLEDPAPRVRLLALHGYIQRLRTPGYSRQNVRSFNERNHANGLLDGHLPTVELARALEADGIDPFLLDAAAQFLTLVPAGEISRRFLESPNEVTRHAALLALRRLARPGIQAFLSDSSPQLVTEAGRAIHDVPITPGFMALAQMLTRVDCPTNLFSRVIDANARLASGRHATTIANFAGRADISPSARALAIRTLGEWAEPPPLDRVNGLWRPLVAAKNGESYFAAPLLETPPNPALAEALKAAPMLPPGPLSRFDRVALLPPDLGRSATYQEGMAVRRKDVAAKKAFLVKAGEYIATGDATIQSALVQAAVRLRAKEASTPLYELLKSASTPLTVRAALVPALVALNAVTAEAAVRFAFTSTEPTLRASAVPYLDRLGTDHALELLAPAVAIPDAGRDIGTAQAAYKALAKLELPAADALIAVGLQSLTDGSLAPTLALDVVTAAEQRAPQVPALATGLAEYQKHQPPSEPLARYQNVLQGGSAARGRTLFFEHPGVQCLRCHQVAAAGGTVGPKLDGIGKLRDRTYLLESIVQPNKQFAEGFQPAPGTLSAMPEGLGDALNRMELRDLVEFLASLK